MWKPADISHTKKPHQEEAAIKIVSEPTDTHPAAAHGYTSRRCGHTRHTGHTKKPHQEEAAIKMCQNPRTHIPLQPTATHPAAADTHATPDTHHQAAHHQTAIPRKWLTGTVCHSLLNPPTRRRRTSNERVEFLYAKERVEKTIAPR
jgi:hypothetical protein